MEDTTRTAELRRKIEKDPGSRLFAQLAEELRKEGRHEEAISVARKGLEKNPNYPSARLTLARSLLDTGRPQEAKPELDQVVKASPDNILASRLLGDALEDLGSLDLALQQFERTLRLSPSDKALIEKIAQVRATLSSPALAPAGTPAGPSVAPGPRPSGPIAAAEAAGDALPSVFGDDAPTTTPEVLAPPPAVGAPAPVAASSVALDRDLASGTFSPGSLNVADLQKHFEEEAAAPAAADDPIEELPSVDVAADDPDLGAKTLPLTSLTLADLYLQQGLKAEASAVLSQVIRDEPQNAQARSKFAAVSNDLSAAMPEPVEHFADADRPRSAETAIPSPRVRRTRVEIREQTILSLRAFQSAVEREAIHQRATELSTR